MYLRGQVAKSTVKTLMASVHGAVDWPLELYHLRERPSQRDRLHEGWSGARSVAEQAGDVMFSFRLTGLHEHSSAALGCRRTRDGSVAQKLAQDLLRT